MLALKSVEQNYTNAGIKKCRAELCSFLDLLNYVKYDTALWSGEARFRMAEQRVTVTLIFPIKIGISIQHTFRILMTEK